MATMSTLEMAINYEINQLQEQINSIPVKAKKADLVAHIEELGESLETTRRELVRKERKEEEHRTTLQWIVGIGFVIYTFVLTAF